MAWTDDRVEILKKLWAEGLSASQIARELGDVTRNAVIGKVHRLGLAGRASPTKPKSRLRHREHIDYGESSYPGSSRSRINDNVKPLVMPEPAVTSDGEPINILSLNEKVCKWPIGEPGDDDFRFCGNRKENGSPYCAEHTRVAYQPLEKKKKKNKVLNKRMPASKINNF